MEGNKYSTAESMFYKRGEKDFPLRVEIELSSACNLRCTYCPRRYLDSLNGFIDFKLFGRLIDEISAYPETILVLHRRGESLLHPDFIEICDYVKDKFKEVQLATNATLLDDKRSMAIIEAVDFISFSIDVPSVFDKTRIPAKYKDVESNILNFLKLNNGEIRTQVSMVKTRETKLSDEGLFKKIWLGKVDRVRIYEEHSSDGKFGSLLRNRDGRVPCAMPFYEILVYYNGKVGRCNHDWAGDPMGDVNISSIKEIWHNSSYQELRRQHKILDIKDKVCKDCQSWYPEAGKQETGEIIE